MSETLVGTLLVQEATEATESRGLYVSLMFDSGG